MANYVDISVPLTPDMVGWENSKPFGVTRDRELPEDDVNDSTVRMSCHAGSHVDAPSHHLEEGRTVDQWDPDRFFNRVRVVEISGDSIDEECIESMDPSGIDGFLFKTKNRDFYPANSKFREDYVALVEDGAKQLVEFDISCVGIDYLSIEPYSSSGGTHRTLFENDIFVLEGLDLREVLPGDYELITCPLPFEGLEASPIRAILKE